MLEPKNFPDTGKLLNNIIEGKIEGKIEDIYKFMMRRFGANPNEVMPKIQQPANLETLDGIMEKLFAANTLEEAWSILAT